MDEKLIVIVEGRVGAEGVSNRYLLRVGKEEGWVGFGVEGKEEFL